jgi:hypothetical protein
MTMAMLLVLIKRKFRWDTGMHSEGYICLLCVSGDGDGVLGVRCVMCVCVCVCVGVGILGLLKRVE